MKVTTVADRAQEILAALSNVIVGKGEVLEQILAGILANGHILIEDYPGLAKTLIAHLFAEATGLGFKRIQFTPDLLPSDITSWRSSGGPGRTVAWRWGPRRGERSPCSSSRAPRPRSGGATS